MFKKEYQILIYQIQKNYFFSNIKDLGKKKYRPITKSIQSQPQCPDWVIWAAWAEDYFEKSKKTGYLSDVIKIEKILETFIV